MTYKQRVLWLLMSWLVCILLGFLIGITLAAVFAPKATQFPETAESSMTETANDGMFASPLPDEADFCSPPEKIARIYNIPLSEELQEYTFIICEDYGVDYELVLAVMEKESSYRPNLISKTGDHGIMQINECNHEKLEKTLGVNDFLDAKQNILCGVHLLGELSEKYSDPHRVLMAYNFGEAGARRYVAKGNTSSRYSRSVMACRAELLKTGGELSD